jgi:SOS-response transcriptional repressor LexA
VVNTILSPLTDRQREILTFIIEQTASNGFPPTYREIMRRFDFRSPTAVICHIKPLQRKGYLATHNGTLTRSFVPLRHPDGSPLESSLDILRDCLEYLDGCLGPLAVSLRDRIERHLQTD